MYYQGNEGGLPPRVAAPGTRIRIDNGGTYLRDALGDIYSLIKTRLPGATIPAAPTSSSTTTAIKLLSTAPTLPKLASSFIQPVTAAPTVPLTSPAPVSAPTIQPAPSSFSPVPPPPDIQTTPQSGGSSGNGFGTAASAAAPIIGLIDPAAGAAAALAPAFANAVNQPETTQFRFSDDSAMMPDTSGPEIYNADGTPATTTAKVATFTEKIKALPPAAKLGGAALLFILFSRK